MAAAFPVVRPRVSSNSSTSLSGMAAATVGSEAVTGKGGRGDAWGCTLPTSPQLRHVRLYCIGAQRWRRANATREHRLVNRLARRRICMHPLTLSSPLPPPLPSSPVVCCLVQAAAASLLVVGTVGQSETLASSLGAVSAPWLNDSSETSASHAIYLSHGTLHAHRHTHILNGVRQAHGALPQLPRFIYMYRHTHTHAGVRPNECYPNSHGVRQTHFSQTHGACKFGSSRIVFSAIKHRHPLTMSSAVLWGRHDRRTKKGKRYLGTFGKVRRCPL